MKRPLAVLLFLGGISHALKAQDSYTYRSADEIYKSAYEFVNNDEMDKAYLEFMSVPVSDTAYFEARYKAMILASIEKRFDTTIRICKEALRIPVKHNAFKSKFLNGILGAYTETERYERAIEFADSLLEHYPYYHTFHYNKALALEKLERFDEAVLSYQDAIRYNPSHNLSHLRLGLICIDHGDLTKGMLCLNMAAYIKAGTETGLRYLSYLETAAKGEFNPERENLGYPEREDFSDVDLIIKNKLAFNKKYKVDSKLNFPFIAQNQIMFENIKFDKGDKGFWNQNYVRFFYKMYKEGLAEGYSYVLASSVDNEDVQRTVSRKKGDMDDMLEWSRTNFNKEMNARTVREGKKYVENHLWHVGAFGFNARSNYNERKEILTGKYIGYHENGEVSVTGEFDDKGLKQGKWTYYNEDGSLNSSSQFVDDKLEGDRIFYFANDSRSKVIPVENEMIVDGITTFYEFDQPYTKISYKDGKEAGPAIYYHRNGNVMIKGTIVDGKINGEFIEYYPNKQVSSKKNFVDGDLDGKFESFYNDGAKMAIGQHEKGDRIGEWKWFFRNGKLMKEGKYDNGKQTGRWTAYYENGTKKDETIFGAEGRKTGVYTEYSEDGVPEMELVYKGEDIISYKFFDSKGEVSTSGEKKRRELDVIAYNDDKSLRLKGSYFKDRKVGKWEYHDHAGYLSSIENYNDDGELDGEVNYFFRNGEIETVVTYENGERNGKYVDYYKNGEPYILGWYEDGEPVGEWKYFYYNGNLKQVKYFQDGELNGFLDYYDEKGRLMTRYEYFNGYVMTFITYDTLGSMTGTCEFVKGKATCPRLHYGIKRNEFSYVGSQVDGPAFRYWPNGEIKMKREYASGEDTGDLRWYFEDGSVEVEGQFDMDGERTGKWTWYHKNGTPSSIITYKNGDATGDKKWYYKDGQLETVRPYKYGERHGASKYYEPNGNLQLVRYHDHGAMIGYSYEDSNGELKPMTKFNAREGAIKANFKNGKSSYLANYKNGYMHGEFKTWYATGAVYEEGTYNRGDREGKYTVYYANGNPKKELNYLYDNLDGKYKEYYENGQLKTVENYILDSRYGWAVYYNKDGSVKEKKFYSQDIAIKTE